MSKLFSKVCTLTIGDRQLSYPPIDIEFDSKLAISQPPSTEVKLYNPNEDTISTVAKIVNGYGPTVSIDAGFEEWHGECVNGYVTAYSVKKEHTDKILTFQVTDSGNKFEKIINKTYLNQNADVILKDMISAVGVKNDSITIGTNKFYKTFTAKMFSDALATILKDTASISYYQNGFMTIQPKTLTTKQKYGYSLSLNSGLINVPEKALINGVDGIKFQTLYLFNLYAGSIFKIDSRTAQGLYQIQTGTKKFSSFGKAECEFYAVPV